jgi:hypothetical protein
VAKRPSNVPDREHSATADEIVLSYDRVARFRITRGSEIIVDPHPHADDMLLRVCLLGPAIGCLLHQRGLLVLHGSAVRIHGGASIFLGGKGWGKSTLAAFLHARGRGLVADDVAAMQLAGNGVTWVHPGSPQIKLWPSAAGFLGIDPERLPRLQPDLDKREACADGQFSLEPLPLRRIYIIELGESVDIEPVRPQEGILELVRHSYLLRFLGASGTSRPHFRQCSALVQSIGVHRLKRPADIQQLPRIADLLEKH